MSTPVWAAGEREWAALDRECKRRGLRIDRAAACPCCGEVWQFMGGQRSDATGWTALDFRHRHHPDHGGRVGIRVRLRNYDRRTA